MKRTLTKHKTPRLRLKLTEADVCEAIRLWSEREAPPGFQSLPPELIVSAGCEQCDGYWTDPEVTAHIDFLPRGVAP